MPSKSSKAILCFHGTGLKGAIFKIQMSRLRFELRDAFDFIFLDGPMECPAGPGVLPLFSDQGPYYGWFGDGISIEDNMEKITVSVEQAVKEWRASNINLDADAEIVGALGFSEGALALAMMLWYQQQDLIHWLLRLMFAIDELLFLSQRGFHVAKRECTRLWYEQCLS